ncbi:hypothetical protein BV20DRAFT_1045525 [Pilatotrama ljubarskyi]|nr:hypothetical protein BV20DRAFT_1045525 [Pilatotrama ljubarskyi]
MALDVQLLRDTALDVIRNVVKEDKLYEFTYGTFRKKVEQTLSLESGTLDAPEYKAAVHAVAKDYISKLEEGGDTSEEEDRPTKRQKPSSASGKDKQVRKPRAKADKAKATARKPAKGKKPIPRSASVVPSSDEEARSGTDAEASSSKPKSKANSSAKQKRIESESEADDAADQSAELPSKVANQAPASADNEEKPAAVASRALAAVADGNGASAVRADDDAKSESEMSVLIDEPPSRKRKKKGESGDLQTKKATKSKKRKDSVKELSKDEETIKRLKSLVVACGVRKVWSKEFKDLEKPSDQIRRLKQILSDLGMSGRMSMEQAKAIKAKREFEKELEDVQEFASKVVSGPSLRRRGAADGDANDEEDGSDVDMAPKRRTARQSIMAFLGDESE